MKHRRTILIGFAIFSVAAVGVAATHNVTTKPTSLDVVTASALLRQSSIPGNIPDYHQQVTVIAAIQRAVLAAAPPGQKRGIPLRQTRELSDVLRLHYGLCFDRSRAIETVLRVAGFKARHVAIYSLIRSHSVMGALTKRGIISHAVTEVKTTRGWMVVDSNRPWLGLTKTGEPISMEQLGQMDRNVLAAEPYKIFNDKFTWIYGLYSRHGQFYPPYDPVPDVSWPELADNI